jgi:hypothetical protein
LDELNEFKRNIKPVYFVRQVAIYLAWIYCRVSHILTAIGKKLELQLEAKQTQGIKAMIIVQNNKELKKKIREIEKCITWFDPNLLGEFVKGIKSGATCFHLTHHVWEGSISGKKYSKINRQ